MAYVVYKFNGGGTKKVEHALLVKNLEVLRSSAQIEEELKLAAFSRANNSQLVKEMNEQIRDLKMILEAKGNLNDMKNEPSGPSGGKE